MDLIMIKHFSFILLFFELLTQYTAFSKIFLNLEAQGILFQNVFLHKLKHYKTRSKSIAGPVWKLFFIDLFCQSFIQRKVYSINLLSSWALVINYIEQKANDPKKKLESKYLLINVLKIADNLY